MILIIMEIKKLAGIEDLAPDFPIDLDEMGR